MQHGIRDIAEDMCTRQLGYRTGRDSVEAERREISEHRFTSLDRAILREADHNTPGPQSHVFTFVKNVARAQLSDSARIHLSHVDARLAFLQRMGLAELHGPNTWHVRHDLEEILRAMQRASDRQKTLAAHGVPMSDKRLPIQVLDTHTFTAVEGRILVHGQDEHSGRDYLMLEGADAKVHFIEYTPEMQLARSTGKLRTNAFVQFRNLGDRRGAVDIRDLGDAEKLLTNRNLLRENARALVNRGVIPSQDGWGGWLGQYQAALSGAALEIVNTRELQLRETKDRKRDRSRGR